MISAPLKILLVPYIIIVVIFACYALINISHLVRYGATTKISFFVTFGFMAGTVIIGAISWWSVRAIDWERIITIGTTISAPSIGF